MRELARELYEIGADSNNNINENSDTYSDTEDGFEVVSLADEEGDKLMLQLEEKDCQIPLDRRKRTKVKHRKEKTRRRRNRKQGASLHFLSIISTLLTIGGITLALYSLLYPHWLETTADLALPKIKLPLSTRSILIRLKLQAEMALYRACIKLNVTASTVEVTRVIDTIKVMEVSKCYDKDSKMKRRKRRSIVNYDDQILTDIVNDVAKRRHHRWRRGIFVKNPYGTDVLFMMRHFVYVAIGLLAASFMAVISLLILLCVSPCTSTCMCRCCKRTSSIAVVLFTSMLSSAASLIAVYIASSELGRDGDFLLEGMALMKGKLYRQRSNPIVQLLLQSPLEEYVRDGWTMGLSYYLSMGASACFCTSWLVLMVYMVVIRLNQEVRVMEGTKINDIIDGRNDHAIEVKKGDAGDAGKETIV